MERLPAVGRGLTSALPEPSGAKRLSVAGLFAILAAAALAPAVQAKGPPGGLDVPQTAYLQALIEARQDLDAGGVAEDQRAARALDVLRARAPGEQEVIDALQTRPPGTDSARSRLDIDIATFEQAVRDPDPVLTEQRLRQVLAQGRYHPDQGPLAAIARFLGRIVDALFRPGQGLFSIVLELLLAGVILLVVVLLVPGLRNPLLRRRGAARAGAAAGTEVPEYFAAAERLAAAGEYGAAVRALVAGTMELILGARSFTASPLTVRETFWRSGERAALRPLLMAFERSYYGHHDAARSDYEAAAAAAHDYRDGLVQRSAAA